MPDKKLGSKNNLETNTAFDHNNGIALPHHTFSERFLSNHTFSFLSSKSTNSIQENRINLESINLLFSAFNRIFDIVMYPEHKKIKRMRSETGRSRIDKDASSVFYHGHLKGMKEESDVSFIFHDRKIVSKVDTLLNWTTSVRFVPKSYFYNIIQ